MLLLLAAGMASAGCGDETGGGSTATSASSATGSGTGGAGGGTTGSGGSVTTGSGSGGGSTTGSGGGGSGGGTAASTGTFMTSPCTGNACDITFIGMGFSQHDGQTLHAGVVPQGSSGFDWEDSQTVMGGAFSMQGTAVLTKGQAYFLNYYADVNQNGICEPNQGDHIWRLQISQVQDNVIVTVPHDVNFSNLGCGGF
jgi:hypothetical protein